MARKDRLIRINRVGVRIDVGISIQWREVEMWRALRSLILVVPLLAGLSILPASAQTPREKYPQVYTVSPLGVNVQTGSYTYSKEDFRIGSLPFVRSWRASAAFGYGNFNDPHFFGAWNHNYGFGVNTVDEYPVGLFADVYVEGARIRHGYVTTNTWQPTEPDSMGTLLTQSGFGSFTFRNKKGDVYLFSSGKATQVDYANGTRLTFGYNGSGQLHRILSSKGDAIVLDYTDGRISTACGYNRALHYVSVSTTCSSDTPEVKVTYGYTKISGKWMLTSVVDARNVTHAIQYDTWYNPNLTCIKIPSTAACEVTNSYSVSPYPDRVTQQVTATGEIWNYSYSYSGNSDGPPQMPGETWYTYAYMTDPLGFQSAFSYVNGYIQGALLRDGPVQYEWDGAALKKFTYPLGNQLVLNKDDRQNITSDVRKAATGSGEADIITTYAFPASGTGGTFGPSGCAIADPKVCNKPTSMTDPRGNVTDYTYDSAHGGVLTETGPAVNGVRPQTRYTYAQRYAWIKNSGGGYSQAETPIWLLAQKSSCKTGAASGTGCAVSGDEVITTFDYGSDSGPNTLLLRGQVEDAGGIAARTCFTYDALGRKISETKPRAGLTVCP